ncbi:uncharacterized protein LOC126895100 isoform X2 [Daktulosphaira vitifoliae]|nr:uncharacterized protein LOC126895100 isoform X2 [Daktulosphaira vitifoliae]
MRNILENLKINQEIQSLFETNQLFEQFINETVLIIDRDKPIDEECPICCENADITLWDCNHPICKICFEKCLIKRKKTCPLCRSVYKNITSNEEYCFAIFSFLKLISKEIKHNLGWNKTYSDSYTQTEEYLPEKVPIDTSGELSSGGHGENIYRTFPYRDMSSTVFKRTPSPRIKELIEKYDNFFYDKDLNSSTNAVHNRNVLIKTFDFGDQCDQKIKIQIDTKKPRSSIYDIYRTLPFRDMSLSVFKTTPSSRLSKLIEKFDNFFYVKSLNLSTNAVHNNGVLKSKFSFEDQYDKKEAHFNVQPN